MAGLGFTCDQWCHLSDQKNWTTERRKKSFHISRRTITAWVLVSCRPRPRLGGDSDVTWNGILGSHTKHVQWTGGEDPNRKETICRQLSLSSVLRACLCFICLYVFVFPPTFLSFCAYFGDAWSIWKSMEREKDKVNVRRMCNIGKKIDILMKKLSREKETEKHFILGSVLSSDDISM